MNRLDRIEASIERGDYKHWYEDDLRSLVAVARAAAKEHFMDNYCRSGHCTLCNSLAPLLAVEEDTLLADDEQICPRCQGKGKIPYPNEQNFQIDMTCPACILKGVEDESSRSD